MKPTPWGWVAGLILGGWGWSFAQVLDTGSVLRLPVVVRDFDTTHPDFENPHCGQRLLRGLVADTLGPGRKPIAAANTPCASFRIQEWFGEDSRRQCRELKLTRSPGASVYAFDSEAFYPIDDVPGMKFSGTDGKPHNFHFCLESHASFVYRGGETLPFKADDDLFVYVNGRLAVDLGGNHGPLPDLLDLDARAEVLGLVRGKAYPVDIFYCERNTPLGALTLSLPPLLGLVEEGQVPVTPAPAALQIGDAALNALGDTLELHARSGVQVLTALREGLVTLEDGCRTSTVPNRQKIAALWSGLGAQNVPGAAFRVPTDSLSPGDYTISAHEGDSRDSVVVRLLPARVALPTATPRGTMACGPFRVSLFAPTPGAVIWYTTGNEPFPAGGGETGALDGSGTSWRRYENVALDLTPKAGEAVVLRYVAVKPGFEPSAERREVYLLDRSETPVLNPAPEAITAFPATLRLGGGLAAGTRVRYRIAFQDDVPGAPVADSSWLVYDPARGIVLGRPAVVTLTAQQTGCRESEPLVAGIGLPQLAAPRLAPASQVFWPTLAGIRADPSDSLGGTIYVAVDSGLGRVETPAWRPQGQAGLTVRQTVTVRAMVHRRGYRNSPVTERRYALGGPEAVSAGFFDADGDGRIESAAVRFRQVLPRPPRALVLDPRGGASGPAVSVSNAEEPGVLRLRFAPLPEGTGFDEGPWIQIAADSIYPGMSVRVADSAPPVLLGAESVPLARRGQAEVRLRFSEPVALDSGLLGASAWPFNWRRSTASMAGTGLLLRSTLTTGFADPALDTATFDAQRPFPAPGDSLYPQGVIVDRRGLAVRKDKGIRVAGESPLVASHLTWKAPGGPTPFKAFESGEKLPAFVVTDETGAALAGDPEKNLALAYQGPLFGFPVQAAGVKRVSLKVFDHLGQVVNDRVWEPTPAEAGSLRSALARQGGAAQLHMRWTPVSKQGRPVGTGVYILWGEVEFEPGLSRDAYGQPSQRQGGRASFGPMRIGVIRE